MDEKIRIYAVSEWQILATDDNGHWYRANHSLKNVEVNDMVSIDNFYELDKDESRARENAKYFRKLINENPSSF